MTAESFFGIDGRPVVFEGIHRKVYERDLFGNEIRLRVFGTNGELADSLGSVAEVRTTYDNLGRKSNETFFNARGQKSNLPGKECHEIKLDYDQFGRPCSESFWGLEGERVQTSGGVHRIALRYNDIGVRQQSYFDASDRELALRSVLWVYAFGPKGVVDIDIGDGLLALDGTLPNIETAEEILTSDIEGGKFIELKVVRKNQILDRRLTKPIENISLGAGQALIRQSQLDPANNAVKSQKPQSNTDAKSGTRSD
jgi:hypothetical protein